MRCLTIPELDFTLSLLVSQNSTIENNTKILENVGFFGWS